MRRVALCAGLLLVAAVALVPASQSRPLPKAPGCPVFPAGNHWNLPVHGLPRHPSSDAIVRSIGLDETMHADFGSGRYDGGPIGIPFVIVGARQRRVPVRFGYADESAAAPACRPLGPQAASAAVSSRMSARRSSLETCICE